jgi:Threonine dehydrogenase and related Zn-dependent dehydrogenases
MVDRVFEATGNSQSIAEGLELLAPRGILTACGVHFADTSLDVSALVRRRQQIRGAFSSTSANWREVIMLLEAHGELFRQMITDPVVLADAEHGFELARGKGSSKVLVEPSVA